MNTETITALEQYWARRMDAEENTHLNQSPRIHHNGLYFKLLRWIQDIPTHHPTAEEITTIFPGVL